MTYDALVNDLRGHTYCCGDEKGLFRTIPIACIYLSCSVSVQEPYSLVISLLSCIIPEITHSFKEHSISGDNNVRLDVPC